MVTYKFKLQSLLNQKKNVKEIFQKQFCHIENSLNKEKEGLSALKEKHSKFNSEINQKTEKAISVGERKLYGTYLGELYQDIQRQKSTVRLVEEELEQKRGELIHVMQEQKALEKLKEKKIAEHLQTEAQQEQDFMNEIAVCRFRNRNQTDSNEG
jgi:flagellar export protein FliJ